MKTQKNLIRILMAIVTAVTPFVLLMLSVRLLITPSFAKLAYQLPGFPDDTYGFSAEDRLRWSEPSIKFLVNNEDISYLSALAFEDGEPIFNARELSHMVDVKAVVTGMRVALALLMIILLVVAMIAARNDFTTNLLIAFHWGGWATVGFIVAILLFVTLNFNSLFGWFHKIFFESGTWQFDYSDSLIRLFPMRFWRDAFIFVGLLSLLFGGLVILATRRKAHFS